MPEKLKQMQDIFYAEAKKHDVLPLDNSTLARWNTPRPNLTAGRTVFTYSGGLTGVPNSGAPSILNKSYTITAEVEIPEGGAEGMIVTDGGRFGGYGLFLSKGELGIGRGKPVFLYNLLDLKRTTWEGPELGAGKHTIVFDFKSDGPGLGKGGTGVLYVDGKEVARNSMEHTTPITFPEDETFDIGQDTRTGVAMLEYRYDVPFKFTGKINKLTFNLGPEQLTAEEREEMHKAVAHGAVSRRRIAALRTVQSAKGLETDAMKRVLVLAAVGEAATGLALLIVPSLVGRLLFGEELTGVAIPVARVTGIALIALGVACWPGTPLVGMLTYSAAVTLYLAYVGFAGGLTGILLWPAVVLHVILTALLTRASTSDKETKT